MCLFLKIILFGRYCYQNPIISILKYCSRGWIIGAEVEFVLLISSTYSINSPFEWNNPKYSKSPVLDLFRSKAKCYISRCSVNFAKISNDLQENITKSKNIEAKSAAIMKNYRNTIDWNANNTRMSSSWKELEWWSSFEGHSK